MGIQIGDNNKIKNVTISENCEITEMSHKLGSEEPNVEKRLNDKHPILAAIFVAVIAGVILMFRFWENLVSFIQGLF